MRFSTHSCVVLGVGFNICVYANVILVLIVHMLLWALMCTRELLGDCFATGCGRVLAIFDKPTVVGSMMSSSKFHPRVTESVKSIAVNWINAPSWQMMCFHLRLKQPSRQISRIFQGGSGFNVAGSLSLDCWNGSKGCRAQTWSWTLGISYMLQRMQ